MYNCLYEAVKRELTEDDTTDTETTETTETTDWEGCKGLDSDGGEEGLAPATINAGKIGFMVLGSWAVPQMQQAGLNATDIGYMAFPITVKGKQYAAASIGGALSLRHNRNYGINYNAPRGNQIASLCFVKYLVEKSDCA